ncbi:MAG: HAD-IIB family hydrolase [Pseudanabaenaceae cyanobacterium bins.39]|nr:HAD-IIB family hydrolase [Pseudanabaenaceae cyanobacterium bins.39]
MQKLFICTDLDRTLLPNGAQPESPEAREKFTQLVSRPEVTLAYVSGRNLALVQEAIASYQLPMPDWIVGDVGSTIYQFQDDEWQYWQSWEEVISKDWQGCNANELLTLFADLTDLTPQETEKQNRFKLSYYLPLDADLSSLQNEMALRLRQKNMAASLIYSVDEAAAIGLLDILPAIATKLHAIQFLMQHQGFSNSHTIFAGDSGNDLPAIVSDIPAVLVANAHPDVIKQAQFQIEHNSNQDYFYLAKGNFLGMNGNYSAGILEGIAHYYPSTKDWMSTTNERLMAKSHVSNLD